MRVSVNNLQMNLGDFAFQIKRWELPSRNHLLLEGPSGAGKTTFLHLLAGLVAPMQGQIQVGEFQIHQMSAAQLAQFRRQKCGMIFQKIHLIPHLSLGENILVGCRSRVDEERIDSLVERLGLQNRRNHLPNQLSLGETQRAAVARALVCQPEIIFADEPTSGLDDKNAGQVLELLQEFAKGKTLVLVSHDYRVKKYFTSVLDFRELLR